MSRYGRQPASVILSEGGYSLAGVARRFGLSYDHLRAAVRGVIAPSHEVRDALVQATRQPVVELFTLDALTDALADRSHTPGRPARPARRP